MKKIVRWIGLFLWGLYLWIGIYHNKNTAFQRFLEKGIINQYTILQFLYPIENFIPIVNKNWEIPLYQREIIRLPLQCNEMYCFPNDKLEIQARKWTFNITPILMYETVNTNTLQKWPYFFYRETHQYVEKDEKFIISKDEKYQNLSGNVVPSFLPKKYGDFIFANPIEIYYSITPSLIEGINNEISIHSS